MKFEFTDTITKDKWIEEYKSLDKITEEVLEGCTYKFIYQCSVCKKEIKTKNEKEAIKSVCKSCK